MKYIKLYLLAITAIIGASGCKKEFLNINTNPNGLPTATPSVVMSNALYITGTNSVFFNETGSYWSGQWTQSSSYILSPTIFSYQFTNGDFNYWDAYYDNLQDYQFVINNADANNQKFLKGPAKVMKAYIYQNLVDWYGNVPYTDALKDVASLAPKFDDQKFIYEDLIKLLDGAIVDMKANAFASAFSSADIVFNGNLTKWIKFANSLKLRILMHQSRIAGRDAYLITEINKIVSEGSGFITGEEVGVGGPSFFVATAGKTNTLYDRWGYDPNGSVRALARYPRPTKFLFDQLIASNDTFRLKRIAYAKGGENGNTPGVSVAAEVISNYVGVPFGISSGFTAPASSYIGPSVIVKGEYNRPLCLMTAAEIQFSLAEAKQRFSAVTLPGTAKSYYEDGVLQSFRLLGVANTSTRATTLLNSGFPDADWNVSADKLKTIAVQKWIALTNFSGQESYTEYRKSNLPVTPQASTVTTADRPLRLFYPNTEFGSNGANVTAQGTIDIFKTRIFWDVD
ncbi:MAG: SusD/RagB family nutrient-binding outer membrane lipoprotein [Sediminibacterium sp.]